MNFSEINYLSPLKSIPGSGCVRSQVQLSEALQSSKKTSNYSTVCWGITQDTDSKQK